MSDKDGHEVLTPREFQVLLLHAGGSSLKEIGEGLGVSYHTVRNHSHNLKEKLGARNLAHAYVIAVRATKKGYSASSIETV